MSETVEWGVRRDNRVQVATSKSAREAGMTREDLARDRADASGHELVRRVRTVTTTEWEEVAE